MAKEAKEKKGGKKRLVIKIVAVTAALGLLFMMEKGKIIKPHYGPGHGPAAAGTFDLGTVTTNLSDGHMSQIDVVLQLSVAANSKLITKDQSVLVGDTVTIVGAHTYGGLLPAPGRAALRAQLLQEYQKVLGPVDGGQQVLGVLFSSFVLQ
jgi:flagellar basal body-associated protein FliL